MAEIIKRRVIRPSSRKATSDSYKVDTKNVQAGDTLVVIIGHESNPAFKREYRFNGAELANANSIHFYVSDATSTEPKITWPTIKPQKKAPKIIYGKLEIDGKMLVSGFSLYVLEIIYLQKKYFYIGITGDPVYESARSAFYRLSGHLEYKNKRSTQNQLYKALTKIFKAQNHVEWEKCISKTKIVMHRFSIDGFEAKAVTQRASDNYKLKQRELARVEDNVIYELREIFGKAGDRILNRTKVVKKREHEDLNWMPITQQVVEFVMELKNN